MLSEGNKMVQEQLPADERGLVCRFHTRSPVQNHLGIVHLQTGAAIALYKHSSPYPIVYLSRSHIMINFELFKQEVMSKWSRS